jgi:AAA domain
MNSMTADMEMRAEVVEEFPGHSDVVGASIRVEQALKAAGVSSNGHGKVRNMAELLADPPKAPPRLLEPSIIIEGGLTVLAAPTKLGKTNLWLHIAWALTEGKALFGRFEVPRAAPVLMLQLELSAATMYERLDVLRGELGWSEEAQQRFYLRSERALLLDRRGGTERILKLIDECRQPPAVVILDSFNACVGGDPDKSAEARRALHALREVQEQTGVAWGITAEIRKAPAGGRVRYSIDDLKGSNELAYDADAVVMLRPDESRRRLGLHFLAMRHLPGDPPEGLVLIRRGLTFELTEGPTDEDEESVAEVLREHFASGGERTWRECAAAVRKAGIHVRNQTLTDVRKRLISAGNL